MSGAKGVPPPSPTEALGRAVAYAALELVARYVEAHGYLPPTEFVEAVLSSDTVA
ncbi:DUF7919 family protein [Streptomyces parvus]|uniref:DUF7919 family protein n=1 Tax=Streptomyces parvus TaxID=66428 RepID=UPI002100DE8C|nr:hypothetical protein [Streptomyces parvus]MCQ1581158.1 hypothetical protein [Streptomyces parvus]